jgi:hypothetical protein
MHESDEIGCTGDFLSSFDEQITDYTIRGAKFIEKYVDETDQTWVLAEAPLKCLLDGTENILISYILSAEDTPPAGELPQLEEDGSGSRDAYVASIREYRKNIKELLGSKLDEILDTETMVKSILSSGYITPPGFIIGYSANSATSGTAPVDKTLYSQEDYGFISGNSGNLKRKPDLFTGWAAGPDGSGTFYREGSILKIDDRDCILYAQYSD